MKKHKLKIVKPIFTLSILAGISMCLLMGCQKEATDNQVVQTEEISEENNSEEKTETRTINSTSTVEESEGTTEQTAEVLANQKIEALKEELGVVSTDKFQDLKTATEGITGYILCDIDNDEKEELLVSYVSSDYEERIAGGDKFVWLTLYRLDNQEFTQVYTSVLTY